ncbi:VWA domain-containing protein [Saccharospirillum sp. HFRX-1]|uniref:VWA domain-containing protein n=1 Tax=unclassified Saccharospirillum TaxID=2633430 RepID=UPI003721BDC4
MRLLNSLQHLTRRGRLAASTLAVTVLLAGCGEPPVQSRAVYMLMDISGTYTEQLDKAEKIMNYLLGTLNTGDSLALARIDSASFNEEDIIVQATFDPRPSAANDQKRAFQKQMHDFIASVNGGSAYTDVTGGVIQAVDYLNETEAGEKYLLVFSDLAEELPEGHIRDFPIDVAGIQVVALNVTKLNQDNIDPRDYQNRLDAWQARVLDGGGEWQVLNDLERMDRVIAMN